MIEAPPPKGRFVRFDRLTLRGRRWFFRYEGENYEPVAPSEGYNSAAARDKGIEALRHCWGAPVIDGGPK